MDDLPSSPDPLGDEPPSPAHSVARRTGNTLTNHELSTISIPRTIPRNIQLTGRKSSPSRQSPRKRTFELDVGNELSPQKILVTVEAEEAMKRGINRRLFPSSSPVRGDYRREAITTTTVPLNDEIVNESTPRRRGRPRRTSNGTPMPKGKKRAGTPIQTTSRRTRKKGDPESEISILADTPSEIYADSAASKPKAKPRKTPKKASTTQAVPSSQLSNTTKKKRGRPRKALMPEQVAVLADMGDQSTGDVANKDIIQEQSQDLPPALPDSTLDTRENETGRQEMTSEGGNYLSEDTIGGNRSTPTPADVSYSYRSGNRRQNRESPTTSHQEGLGDEDLPMDHGYPTLMEQQSDAESDFDVPHSGQDTLAHASDFSMIAVESLPSFQANRSAFPTDPPEMGDETNQIINETLESLRNSLRTEEVPHQQPADSNRNDLPAEGDRSVAPDGSLAEMSDYSLLGRLRSPRRPKQVPLSRQVFSGKAPHVDDSFSSLPDSILRAATPGRLPMKPTVANDQHEDSGAYDDSFSEIPEAVLEAATPRPARTVAHVEESHAESSTHHGQVSSVNRNTGSNFSSARLPTPDDTSSSNAGSKKAQEEDAGPSTAAPSVAIPTSNSGFQSSPPIMNRSRAMDFGPSQLDQEINNTPEPQQSSPQLPPSAKELKEHREPREPREPTEAAKSLEPPTYNRPSLSPIVRAGRTLQNVMSDKPSPERRESSLGSPFRGPANNEPSQSLASNHSDQLSVSRSPSRSNYGNPSQFNTRSLFNPNPTVAQSILSNFRNQQSAQDAAADLSDPFGSDRPDYSQTEALRRAAYNTDDRVSQSGRSALFQSVASSTRAMPPSENELDWAADSNNQQEVNHRADSQTMRSQNSSIFGTRGTSVSEVMARNVEAEEREAGEREAEVGQIQELGEQTNGEITNYDETDLWDFEASRPTPKRPERGRRTSQANDPATRRVKIPSPWRKTARRLIYREEIASPSQIEIEENPQSEAEEAPPVRPRSRVSDVHSIILRRSPDSDHVDERMSYESEEEVQRSLLEIQEIQEQPIEQDSEHLARDNQEQPIEHGSEYSTLDNQEQPVEHGSEHSMMDNQEQPAEHASEYSMLDHQENPIDPAHSSEYPPLYEQDEQDYQDDQKGQEELAEPVNDSEYSMRSQERQPEHADASEYSMLQDQYDEDDHEEPAEPLNGSEYLMLSQEKQKGPIHDSEYSMLDTHEEPEEPEEPVDASEHSTLATKGKQTRPADSEYSILATQERQPEPAEVSEYSMLAQRKEDAPSTQKKSVATRSGIFGGFNILSFFSSPASLPNKAPEAGPAEATRNTGKVAQPVFQRPAPRKTEQQQQPKEPQKSLWSTGLFPSIPQKEFRPSPERRTDLFSPGPALRSNDTVQDTYESPSPAPYSPEPESPQSPQQSPEQLFEQSPERSPEQSPQQTPEPSEPSPQPSTPEQQIYPPIEQKRNFTPRPGQSGGSLFRTGPSTVRSEMTDDGLLLPPSDEIEQHESSILTDGTEYERLPPREKPSRWDRTLSPTKSCFRSPMKPTTPGRVVAFKPSALSPTVQAEARAQNQVNGRNKSNGVLFQGPSLFQPVPQRREEQSTNTSSSQFLTRLDAAPVATTVSNNSPPKTNRNQNTMAGRPRRPSSSPKSSNLSQKQWSREHWVRLDEMLQLRRRDPLAFQQQMPLPPRSQRKSFSTLLGKEVAAQGESVLLEPWHLEVVEAFKKEVGGWDERALAKRVFALIVGEERRRKGLIGNKGKGRAVAAS